MATFINILFILCVTAGITALIAGGISIFSLKGQCAISGARRWYRWAITAFSVHATALVLLNSRALINWVGDFSFFLLVSLGLLSSALGIFGLNRSRRKRQSRFSKAAVTVLTCFSLLGASAQNGDAATTIKPRFWQGIHYGSQLNFSKGQGQSGIGLESRITLHSRIAWGYAEAFINVPSFIQAGAPEWNGERLRGRHRFETGLRIYPWATKPGAIRPFAGISTRLLPTNVDKGEGINAVEDRLSVPLQVGFTYRKKRMFLTVGVQYANEQAVVMLQFNRSRRGR